MDALPEGFAQQRGAVRVDLVETEMEQVKLLGQRRERQSADAGRSDAVVAQVQFAQVVRNGEAASARTPASPRAVLDRFKPCNSARNGDCAKCCTPSSRTKLFDKSR